jgi:hypothetical protein
VGGAARRQDSIFRNKVSCFSPEASAMPPDFDRSPLQLARRMREAAAQLGGGVPIEGLTATLEEGARTIEGLIEEIESAEACL